MYKITQEVTVIQLLLRNNNMRAEEMTHGYEYLVLLKMRVWIPAPTSTGLQSPATQALVRSDCSDLYEPDIHILW